MRDAGGHPAGGREPGDRPWLPVGGQGGDQRTRPRLRRIVRGRPGAGGSQRTRP